MPTLLPQDKDNHPIPAMRLKAGGGAHSINAITGASTRNTTAFNIETRVVGFYATVPVYMKFGDSYVSAANTDHYFPAGVYYDFAIGGDRTGHATHLAVLAAESNGAVYISEKE